MNTKPNQLQVSLDDKTRRADKDMEQYKRLFLSEKSIIAQKMHSPDDSEKGEELHYQLDGALASKRRAHKGAESLRMKFDTFWATVDSYRRGLPNFTEGVGTDVTDSFCGFRFESLQEHEKLVKKQQDTIQLTVKKDFEAVNAFLRSLESKRSHAGPSLKHHWNRMNCILFLWYLVSFGSFVLLSLHVFVWNVYSSPLLSRENDVPVVRAWLTV